MHEVMYCDAWSIRLMDFVMQEKEKIPFLTLHGWLWPNSYDRLFHTKVDDSCWLKSFGLMMSSLIYAGPFWLFSLL